MMNDGRIPSSKRIFDVVLTTLILIMLSPIFILIVILVLLVHGKPVLFRQKRPGLYGEIFTIYKFRTMSNLRDENGNLEPDSKRLTRLGKFLRSTSLDELPELLNVLKGEMSLVGPRPLLIQYLDRYSNEQARRHEVLPGITGWAQINGRNALSWEERFQMDVWYIDHWSFGLDLKILWITFWKVIKREGINQPGHATAPEFMGNLTRSIEGENEA
jgi:sugar transferase EpsL